MKRLYYLTDSIESAESVADELHQKGVPDRRFHVLAKNKKALIEHHLHRANLFLHERDGIRMAERGAIIAMIAAMVAVFAALVITPDVTLQIRMIILASMLVLCGVIVAFGIGLGIIYGFFFENSKISRFHNQIEAGKYLLMVDARNEEVDKIKNVMAAHHQEAIDAGEDDTLVRPFQFMA